MTERNLAVFPSALSSFFRGFSARSAESVSTVSAPPASFSVPIARVSPGLLRAFGGCVFRDVPASPEGGSSSLD